MKKIDTTFLIVVLAELIMTGYWYLIISTSGMRLIEFYGTMNPAIGIGMLVFWWLLGILITTIVVYVAIRLSMWLKNR